MEEKYVNFKLNQAKTLLKGICLQAVQLTTDNMKIRVEKLPMKCIIHDWTHPYTLYLVWMLWISWSNIEMFYSYFHQIYWKRRKLCFICYLWGIVIATPETNRKDSHIGLPLFEMSSSFFLTEKRRCSRWI